MNEYTKTFTALLRTVNKMSLSTDGADKAINKFGWAAIILALCLGIAAIIAAAGVAGFFK